MNFIKTAKYEKKWEEYTEKERQEIEALIDQQDVEYFRYFDTIKSELSLRFLTLFYEHHGFHDYVVESIQFDNIQFNKASLDLTLNSNYTGNGTDEFVVIQYNGILSYSITMSKTSSGLTDKLQWLDSEFRQNEDKTWTHRILCDADCEMLITFQKI